MNGGEHPPRGRWPWSWLATFFAFVAVAHGNFETTDAGFTMHAARALWQRGDSGLLRSDQGGELLGERLGAEYIAAFHTSGKVGRNGVAYAWFPVGHVWLLVPFVALGDALAKRLPAAESTFRARVAPGVPDDGLRFVPSIVQGTPVVTQGLISLLVPAASAATVWWLLLRLARQLGASARAAAAGSLAIVFATQAFAFGRETLSDGPGLVFLLAALLAVVTVHQGCGSRRGSLCGGLAAGAAVLLRYQNAALLVAIAAVLVLACRRQRRWSDLLAFALGVLPAMGLLFWVDYARFGDIFDTGYSNAANWFDQPMGLGVAKMLFAAGRGVAWFSPLVWLALPLALAARNTPRLRGLAWVLFLFPLLFFARAHGWQGGQCWGARYVTHGLVALLAIVLPQAQPWRRWPKAWWLLVGLGLFVNVTSVVAPVRGVLQLGAQAVEATTGSDVEAADITGWHPRYTPLLANWRYAFASRTGGFEDEHGQPRHGAARAIETVFGVAAATPGQANAPMRWEDRCGRHLWWRFWGDLFAVPGWLLLLPVVLLAGLCAGLARRQAAGSPSDSPTPR